MSPIAQSRSPTRICSSGSSERALGSRPTVSRPMSARLGRRPAATSSASASRSSPSTTRRKPPSCDTRSTFTPVRTSIPSRAKAPRTTSDDSGSSRAEDPVGALEHGDPHPEPAERLRELEPDRTAADDGEALGRFGHPHHLAVGPVRRVRQAFDRRDARLGAGVEDHAARRDVLVVVDPHPALADQPPVAPDEPRSCRLQPLDRDLVVPVVGGLVADPGRDRAPGGTDVGVAGQVVDAPRLRQGVGRPDHHLRGDAAVVGALAPDQPPIHPHHGQAAPRQGGGQRLPARTQPHHHHVDLVRRHGPSLAQGAPQRERCLALGEAEQPVAADPDRDHAEQQRPERLLQHLLQRLVQPAGLLRVVGDGGVHEQYTDDADGDALGAVPDLAEPDVRRPGLAAVALRAQVLLEPLGPGQDTTRDADPDDHQPHGPDDPRSRGQVHQLRGHESVPPLEPAPSAIFTALTPIAPYTIALPNETPSACRCALRRPRPGAPWRPRAAARRRAGTCRTRSARPAPRRTAATPAAGSPRRWRRSPIVAEGQLQGQPRDQEVHDADATSPPGSGGRTSRSDVRRGRPAAPCR